MVAARTASAVLVALLLLGACSSGDGADGGSPEPTQAAASDADPEPSAASESAAAGPSEASEPVASAAEPSEDAPTAPPTASAAPSTGGGADATSAEVPIEGIAFTVPDVTVATGGTVTWSNLDLASHNVTFEEGESSQDLLEGDTFERTFDEAGEFSYLCTIHPFMKGTVTAG